MGLCPFATVQLYWSLYKNCIKYMTSRNRFQLMLKTIHFSDNSNFERYTPKTDSACYEDERYILKCNCSRKVCIYWGDIGAVLKSAKIRHCVSLKSYRKLSIELLTGSALVNGYGTYQDIANEPLSITTFREEMMSSASLLAEMLMIRWNWLKWNRTLISGKYSAKFVDCDRL